MDSKGHEGQQGEEDLNGSEQAEGEDEEKQTRMPSTRLERRRLLNTVAWTKEEEEKIEACKGARAKTREKNRLLHNKNAADNGQHVLAAASGERMRCMACGREADWRRVLQRPKTICQGSAHGQQRARCRGRREETPAEQRRTKEEEEDKKEEKEKNPIWTMEKEEDREKEEEEEEEEGEEEKDDREDAPM